MAKSTRTKVAQPVQEDAIYANGLMSRVDGLENHTRIIDAVEGLDRITSMLDNLMCKISGMEEDQPSNPRYADSLAEMLARTSDTVEERTASMECKIQALQTILFD